MHVLPQDVTIDGIRAIDPVAVFYSNGPGDPAASDDHVELLRGVLTTGCRSSASASATSSSAERSACGTYKLPFGHRGINQPVLDKATGRVEITAHNHGFAVEAPLEGVFDSASRIRPGRGEPLGLNDRVVEGLHALDIRAFSVQYHPEAAAGPHDANYLFDRFRDMVLECLADKESLSGIEAETDRVATEEGQGD